MTTTIVSDRDIKPQELLSMQQASALAGVEVQTLRLWDRAGRLQCVRTEGNHRRVLRSSLMQCLGIACESNGRAKVIGYCRVSTLSQSKDNKKGEAYNGESDLDRQQQRVESFIQERFPNQEYDILTDVGSGLSENRKNYLKLIELICSNSISAIIISSKERLSRFGQESFTKLAQLNGVEIIVVDRDQVELDQTQEMAADVMAIMHVYSCRYYGKRASERRKIELDESTLERIHQLRQAGISYQQIIRVLKQEGITNKNNDNYKFTNLREKYLQWLDHQHKKAVLTGNKEEQTGLMDQWINTRCDLNQNEMTMTKSLFESYCDFLREKGIDCPSHRKFTQTMIKKGFQRSQYGRSGNYMKTLKGITLKGC